MKCWRLTGRTALQKPTLEEINFYPLHNISAVYIVLFYNPNTGIMNVGLQKPASLALSLKYLTLVCPVLSQAVSRSGFAFSAFL
jgi:hypothetical protein